MSKEADLNTIKKVLDFLRRIFDEREKNGILQPKSSFAKNVSKTEEIEVIEKGMETTEREAKKESI